jgi:hypothetical protein
LSSVITPDAAEALARANAQLPHPFAVAGPDPGHELAGRLVPQGDHRGRRPGQLLGPPLDERQEPGQVQLAGDLLHDGPHRLHLPAPFLLLAEEPGVGQGQRRLIREGGEERHLALAEGMPRIPVDGEDPEGPIGQEDGGRAHGAVALGLHQPARRLGELERRIRQDVRCPDGGAPLEAGPGGPLPRPELQRGHGLPAQPHGVEGVDPGLSALLADLPQAAAGRPERLARPFHQGTEDLGRIQRGGGQAGQSLQRFGLLPLPLRLGLALGLLQGDAGVRAHEGQQPHVGVREAGGLIAVQGQRAERLPPQEDRHGEGRQESAVHPVG